MAHCPPERLVDLQDVFAALRALPRIKEKSLGVFYLGASPFLHFHIKDADRTADLKRRGGGWDSLPAGPEDTALLKRQVLQRYDEWTGT